MRRLWKQLPPLMADSFGMIEAVRKTDGMGVIDDCGDYRLGQEHHGGPDTRTCHTGICSEDIITGTSQKIWDAFLEGKEHYHPSFILLSAGPSSAMIGTDLSEAAERITNEGGIPAESTGLSGHKTYDEGISEALCAMARLLCKEQEKKKKSVNLLGANGLDWQEKMTDEVKSWFEAKGYTVIANLGARATAEQIRNMPQAEMNIAVTAAGVKAAQYLNRQYGMPYVAMAPFGREWSELLEECLVTKEQPKAGGFEGEHQKVLIIGEQLMANAIRETLGREYGVSGIRVATFCKLQKELAAPGDIHIRDEDEVKRLLETGAYEVVIGDRLLKPLASEGTDWIELSQPAFALYGEKGQMPELLGEQMNIWLDQVWKER